MVEKAIIWILYTLGCVILYAVIGIIYAVIQAMIVEPEQLAKLYEKEKGIDSQFALWLIGLWPILLIVTILSLIKELMLIPVEKAARHRTK